MTPTTTTKDTAVNPRTYLRYVALAAIVFIAGLGLGAGRSEEDTSAANTGSKVLLTIGFLALVVTGVLEAVRRLRARRADAAARDSEAAAR